MKPQLNPEFIDHHALDIVAQLQDRNFTTYLVGGCVRDLLSGFQPKDYDIVTAALPEQVQKIVRPSYIIGRRFRLVLVRRGGQQYEVSTFRALNYSNEENPEAIDENIYGEPREDALRRDFTINGLFYDPMEKQIIDHTEGMKDVEGRIIRMIGDPVVRIEQDPIRILRALRLAHKLNFSIDPDLRQAIQKQAPMLKTAVLPRVREEILKILRLDNPTMAFWEMYDLGVLQQILPSLHVLLNDDIKSDIFFHLLNQGLHHVMGSQDPYLLYAIFIYSYLTAANESWPDTLSTKFDEPLFIFMRSELGMHRVETEMFTQAINLVKQLAKNASPEKLRPRHREHLLTNRALYLALNLAEFYHHLGHYDTTQWRDKLESMPPLPPENSRRRRSKVRV